MSNLDKDLREARRLGYGADYGRYKLDHPNTMKPAQAPKEAQKPRKCKECGKEFLKGRADKIYCSDECRERHVNRERMRRKCKEVKLPLGPAECIGCGGKFNRKKPTQRYCCKTCSSLAREQQRREERKRGTSSEGES